MGIEDILRRLETSEYGDILVRIIRKNWKDGYQWGWEEGGGKGVAGVDQWTLGALEEKIIQLSEETGRRLRGDLKKTLEEGVRNREGVSELKERVKGVFEGLEGWKTERVVRTEVSQATHQGRNAAWIVTGVPYKMWWNPDVGSKRTADDSKRFHGQIQRVEDPFKDPLDGKLVMTPPNRPQCRCGMRTVRELPKELVWIGGIMYDGRYVQKEASMHKTIDDSVMDILKGGVGSGIKGHTTAPKQGFSHQFREDDYDSTETMMDKVGARLAEKWDVSEEALDSIRKEEGQQIEGLSFEEKRKRVVTGLLRDWASSSGGALPSVMAEHLKSKHGLGKEHRSFLHEGVKGWMDKNPEVRKGLENLADTMYAETQKWFKDRGIKEVTAYRGGFSDDSTKVLTSWSVSYGGARREDTRVNRKEVIPVKNILSTPATGFGTLYESEIVVIGAYDGEEVRKLLTPTILDLDIQKAWTDEAREKALEARRRKMKPEDFEELKKFRNMMSASNPSEIREYCKGVLEQDKAIKDAVTSWYSDRGMAKLDWHATQVFGLSEENNSGKWGSEGNEKRAKESVSGETFKNILKLYIATQVWLDWKYPDVDEITVYRGVDGKTWEKFKNREVNDAIEFGCYNLSCWTVDKKVAKQFLDSDGGIIVEAKVPKKQVLLSWATGDSPYDKEKEITVMGKSFKGVLYDVRDKGEHATRRDSSGEIKVESGSVISSESSEVETATVSSESLTNKQKIEGSKVSIEDKTVAMKLATVFTLPDPEVIQLANSVLPRFDESVKVALALETKPDGTKFSSYEGTKTYYEQIRQKLVSEDPKVVRQVLLQLRQEPINGKLIFFPNVDMNEAWDVVEWSKTAYKLT